MIILIMIIERPSEIRKIKGINKWILVYGRRKTGKTFLVKNFIKFDEYFFVKSNKNILSKDDKSLTYEAFVEILKRSLKDNKTAVVDEFHRLGEDFFDYLHYLGMGGKLILISSTLFLSKRLISAKSPLLGLVAEVPISLINLEDCLKALKEFAFPKKEKLELAILMREPIAISYFNEKKPVREIIADIVLDSKKMVPALVGEIFTEEEREMSAVYEGILRAIAMGKVGSGEISSYLFSRKLIKKDDPSIIQQYLNNLISFGIIRRIQVFNKKRFIYKLSSPLSRIFYYADERYNLSERDIKKDELIQIIGELMPRIVEDSIREFFAEKHGLRESVIEAKDFDIDGCLLRFNKPYIAGEIKWGKLKKEDISKAEENLQKINVSNKFLFVQDKKGINSKLKIIDVDDLLKQPFGLIKNGRMV